MTGHELPVIFAAGAKQKNTFFHHSLYHLVGLPDFLHYHDVLELGVCLYGSGTFITPEGKTHFRAGDVQVIPPFCAHYNVADEGGSLWSFIDVDITRVGTPHVTLVPSFFMELMRLVKHSGIFSDKDSPSIVSLVRSIATLTYSDGADQSPISDLIAAKVTTLMLELSTHDSTKQTVTEAAKRTEIILPAINVASYAVENGKKISPSDMASACFMSESHFRRVFSSIMGEPPKSYITRIRIKKAATLLVTTKLPVLEIAQSCGFEDGSTFYRQFVKAYGISPAAYRAKELRNIFG